MEKKSTRTIDWVSGYSRMAVYLSTYKNAHEHKKQNSWTAIILF